MTFVDRFGKSAEPTFERSVLPTSEKTVDDDVLWRELWHLKCFYDLSYTVCWEISSQQTLLLSAAFITQTVAMNIEKRHIGIISVFP